MSEELYVILDDENVANHPTQTGPWVCISCTYENPCAYLVCEICHTEKAIEEEEIKPVASDSRLAGPSRKPLEQWTCSTCTLINNTNALNCGACGCSKNGELLVASTEHTELNQQQKTAPPALPLPASSLEPTKVADGDDDEDVYPLEEDISQDHIYSLDCGCNVAYSMAAKALEDAASVKLHRTSTLASAIQLFHCPTSNCKSLVTRRDLESLIGAEAAVTVDSILYHRSLHIDEKTTLQNKDAIDLTKTSVQDTMTEIHAPLEAIVTQLGRSIERVFQAVVSESNGVVARPCSMSPPESSRKRGRGGRGGGGRSNGGYQNNNTYNRKPNTSKSKGIGYGGGSHDDKKSREHLEAAAAEKQIAKDELITQALCAVSDALDTAFQYDSTAGKPNSSFSHHQAHLALPIVSVILGSPLAACLRCILRNDSLMEVTGKQELFSQCVGLVGKIAKRHELVALLLCCADGDVLKKFVQERKSSADVSSPPAAAGKGPERKKRRIENEKTKGVGIQKQSSMEATATIGTSIIDTACIYKALELFKVQIELFMKSATTLAAQ